MEYFHVTVPKEPCLIFTHSLTPINRKCIHFLLLGHFLLLLTIRFSDDIVMEGSGSGPREVSMQYGYFDDAAREYVITNPKTPVKWINYVRTLAFGGFLVERTCRGATYRITLGNPEGKSKGVTVLTMDGKPVKGNLIPWFREGIHAVEARL